MTGAVRGSDRTVPEAAAATERHPERYPPPRRGNSSCATQTDTRRLYALRMRPQIRCRSLNIVTLKRPERYAGPTGILTIAPVSTLVLFICLQRRRLLV